MIDQPGDPHKSVVTHQDMLDGLDLTQDELNDLLEKLSTLHESLNLKQQAALRRSLPSMTDAAATFGPGVNEDRLKAFFDQASTQPVVSPINHHTLNPSD
jgi:hypothetical protein